MSAERWKQVVMSACFAVLVLALGAVWACIVTDHPLKKHWHMDNEVTQLVFHDAPGIYGITPDSPRPPRTIDWARIYPFDPGPIRCLWKRGAAMRI
jgi:hypothetical protein